MLFVVGSLLTALFFLEQEDYSEGLVWAIEQFSDYQIIAIDITLIDIASTSTIIAKDLKVTTRSGDQKIKADLVEIQFALISLFTERLDIEKLIIRDAGITITDQVDERSLDSGNLFIPTIEHAEFLNVLISCQCTNNKQLELKIEDISIFDNGVGEINISGEGEFEQTPFQLTGSFGSLQLNRKNLPFPINMALQFSNSSFLIHGYIEDALELEGFDLKFLGSTGELSDIAQHFITDIPELGRGNLTFTMVGSWDDIQIKDLRATLKNNSEIDITAEGSINDLLNNFRAGLHISGNISEPELMTYIGSDLSPAELTHIKFDNLVDINEDFVAIDELDIKVLLNNDIDINLSGSTQFIIKKSHITAPKLDLAITAVSDSTIAITSILGQQLPELGSVTAKARLELIDNIVTLNDINIAIGNEDELKITMLGELEKFTFGSNLYQTALDINIEASGQNIEHIALLKDKVKNIAGIDRLTAKLNLSGPINNSELDVESIVIHHVDGITLQAHGDVQLGDFRQAQSIKNLSLQLDSHAVQMNALSPWFGTQLPLLGEVTASTKLVGQGQNFSLRDLQVRVGNKKSIWMKAEGNVAKVYLGDDVMWSGLAIDAMFQATELSPIATYFELSLPNIKQADGAFKLKGDSDSLAITSLNFSSKNETGITLIGNGSIKNTGLLKNNKLAGIDIDLTADAKSNTSLTSIIEQDLPDFGRLHVTARLRNNEQELGLENIILTVGNSENHTLHATGQIHNILNNHRLSLSARVETEASIILTHILNKDIPDVGIITANISISNHDGSLGIESLEISSANTALYQLTAQGVFDDFQIGDELKFDTDFSIPNPKLLADKLGYQLAEFEAIRFIGHMEGNNEESVFKGDISIGKTHFESDIIASYIDKHLILKGTIYTPQLNLKDIAIHHEKYTSNITDKKNNALFPPEFLPFDLLKNIDLELHISADEIKGTKFDIDTADANIQIHNNVLTITPFSLVFDDGFIHMTTSISIDAEHPQIKMEVQADDIDIGQVTSQFIENHSIEGDLTMHMNFAGTGYSLADIASSLDGDVAIALDNGVLHEDDLALLSIDFLGWFFDHLIQNNRSDLHCAMSHYQIKSGLAELKMLIITSPDLEATGDGNINLKNETIDLTIHTDNKSIFKPKIPIRIKGDLREPTVTILPNINTLTSVIFSVIPDLILADVVLSKFWSLLREGDTDSKCEEFFP